MLKQRLTPGTAMATVDTASVATTGLTATMATTERGPQMQSLQLSPLRLLIPMLMLMPGMATTDTDIVAMDGVATTGLTATDTTERGPLKLSLQLSQLLLLTLKLMLMLGMDTMDMVVTTATGTDTATTAPTDTGVTGAKPTNREVDSSSDCDFPSTLASISRACA